MGPGFELKPRRASATLGRLPDRIHNKWFGWPLFALLATLTSAAYAPVRFSEFIRLDDGFYVVHNPHVTGGFSWANFAWAFQTGYEGNWHPVTWLSHMLDAQLFGLHPLGHHLTNLVLHVANVGLLFMLLRRLTGAVGRSFVVAALFALHPLHVESVAWVAERKDVLSTCCFLLALGAYVRYARPRGGAAGHHWTAYLLALMWFALGLMSKPMLVTFPFVLLLLDVWPLARAQIGGTTSASTAADRPVGWGRLLVEKIPFFALTAASCVVTFLVQEKSHATGLVLPLGSRLANAAASYWRYLGQTVWPVHLAVYYPHPDLRHPISHQWPLGCILLAAVGLAAVSAAVLWRWRRAPWLAVGWFWFLGTLVPVIGLVQVGIHGWADRYTYIPHIGLFIGVVWGLEALWRGRVATLGLRPKVEFGGSDLQPRWTGSRTLATVAGAVVLGCGVLTFHQTTFWQSNLVLFQHALAVTGDSALAHFHVGTGLGELERFDEAKAHFQAAVRTDPAYSPPYFSLGLIAEAEGKPAEAITNYTRVIALRPEWAPGPNQLAWLLATHPSAQVRNGAEAVRLAERACHLTGDKEPHFLATLAAAYAEAGRFEEAVRTAHHARALAQAAGDRKLVAEAEARLALYGRQQPYRQP